jgi:hypothetical protein
MVVRSCLALNFRAREQESIDGEMICHLSDFQVPSHLLLTSVIAVNQITMDAELLTVDRLQIMA